MTWSICNRCLCATIFLVLGLATVPVQGQDPFANNPGEVQTPGKSSEAASPFVDQLPQLSGTLPKSTRLILETIRGSKPTTAVDLAKALQTTLDIDQTSEARYYLGRLLAMNLDSESLFKLNQTLGSDFFLRLHGKDELAPEGKSFARAVFAATKVEAARPERIQQLINKLSDPNSEIRGQAYIELDRTGPLACASMLNVFGDIDRKDEFIPIRNALRSMEDSAIGPLLGAASAEPLQIRYEALTALARMKRVDAYDAAICAYYSPETPEPLREAVALGLELTYGRLPNRHDAISTAFQNARELATGKRKRGDDIRIDREQPYVTVWRWDLTQRALAPVEVEPPTASKLLALDRAKDFSRIEPNNPEFRRFHLTSFLDAEKRLIGPVEIMPASNLIAQFPGLTPEEIDSAIAFAIDHDLIAAASAGCDVLIEMASSEWLVQSQNATSGLTRAIQSGNRHLQFSAFRTIAELDPQRPYYGNSYALATAIYLAGYGDRPSGLVAHPQIDEAQNLAVALNAAGVSGRALNQGRDLFRDATSDSNIQFLLIADSINTPDFSELIQQLRGDWRTSRTPIAIVTDNPNPIRANRVALRDARTIVVPMTIDPRLIKQQIDQLRQLNEPWMFSNQQGQTYGQYCVGWLQKITKNRDTYGFYEVAPHFESLADLILNPLHTRQAIDIMGNIATPQAQRRLVDYASQGTAPIEQRQQAAESFKLAVAQRGLLLTTDEIKLQYARYKASQGESGESQRVLGQILDLIEHRASNSNGSGSKIPVVGQFNRP